MVKKKYEKIDYASLLVAIIAMSGLIITPLINTFNISSNANLYILILEFVVLILFLLKNGKKIKINLLMIYILISVILLFIFSIERNNHSHTLPQFLLYFLIPFFISTQKINTKKILEYSIYISTIAVFSLEYLFRFQYEQMGQSSMGNSYAVAVSVVASILYFGFYKNKSKGSRLINLLLIFNLYLGMRLILSANRGAVLEIVFAFIMVFVSKFDFKTQKTKNGNLKKNLLILIIILVSIVLVMNMSDNMIFLNDLCIELFGVSPSFLSKSVMLSEYNNLSNNRTELYNITFDLIKRKPLVGYGIETFGINTPYPWPHNLFLQFLYEGGILFSFVPILLIVSMIYKVLFSNFKDKSSYILAIFLLIMVFPRYFISNDIWKGPYVWMLLGFCCSHLFKSKTDNGIASNHFITIDD